MGQCPGESLDSSLLRYAPKWGVNLAANMNIVVKTEMSKCLPGWHNHAPSLHLLLHLYAPFLFSLAFYAQEMKHARFHKKKHKESE